MKLSEVRASDIIKGVLGERGILKSETELSLILKKRLTKKEMYAINAQINGEDQEETAKALNVDLQRLEEIIAGGSKKMKKESVHREFYVFD